jgi:2-keto-4-pentenoate hydratase/2-oxohepta-3-ene-1,7-dioic acid hydratase in catechol pathway
MKLLRFGPAGRERPGVIDADGRMHDASSLVRDYDLSLRRIDELVAALAAADLSKLPAVAPGERIGVPVARIGKIVCAGMNYADHCREAGVPIPTEPAFFMKPASALAGPNDAIVFPLGGEKLDWEAELAVVIGRPARDLKQEEALGCVAGYTILNDVSERAFQLERGGQWVKGKACDTFAPLGPWLVTPDEIPDPQALSIELDVNGAPAQRGNTSAMVFGVAHLVAYISQFMTLEPGDVVSTGTPPGVGMGHKPPRWLKPGDIVDIRIAGLGAQRQTVRAAAAALRKDPS